MSGIFGLIYFNEKLVTSETAQAMYDAMAYWGSDGGDTWRDANAVLGQLLLYNTPEALYEKLPRRLPEHNLAFTAEARIDNRDELCNVFNIPGPERAVTPDGDLILQAYLKWGEDCADHLLGDWSFAVWRPAEQRLFLARDHHGNTALYYYANRDFFAFASTKKALLALDFVPKELNELRLAQILVAWPGDGVQTTHQDILHLPPAHTLTATPQGISTHRYWVLEDTPLLNYKRNEDYVEGLREVFTAAVRCRLRSYRPVGSTLSGGLDSGSVSVIAADLLRQEGKRLPAFSSVPLYDVSHTVGPHCFGDETPYINATAEHNGNIDVTYLKSEHLSPIEGIRRMLDIRAAPGHAAGNAYWIVDLLETARQQKLGALLTGQGGNATISWSGKSIFSWGYLFQQGLWKRELKHKILLPLLSGTPIGPMYRRIRYGDEPWKRYSNITHAFARRLNLLELMAAEGHDPTFEMSRRLAAREVRYNIIGPGRSPLGAGWAENGAPYSLEVRDPTTDKRVMAYTLAVPDNRFTGPNGIDRYLLRQAMQSQLPPQVLFNRRRGRQAADSVQRLLAAGYEVERTLADLNRQPWIGNYIDLSHLSDVWALWPQKPLIDGVWAGFTRSIMAGMFLCEYFAV